MAKKAIKKAAPKKAAKKMVKAVKRTAKTATKAATKVSPAKVAQPAIAKSKTAVKSAKKPTNKVVAKGKKAAKSAEKSVKRTVTKAKTAAQKKVLPAFKGMGKRAGKAIQDVMADAAEIIHDVREKVGHAILGDEPAATGPKKKGKR